VEQKNTKDIPTTTYSKEKFEKGIDLITLMVDGKLASSRSDARRTITQGGVSVNDEKVTAFDKVFTPDDFNSDDALLIRKGKKTYHLYKIQE
jgi:tyrosyl-tRNA synthetase